MSVLEAALVGTFRPQLTIWKRKRFGELANQAPRNNPATAPIAFTIAADEPAGREATA
jgi:hypothetical protein